MDSTLRLWHSIQKIMEPQVTRLFHLTKGPKGHVPVPGIHI